MRVLRFAGLGGFDGLGSIRVVILLFSLLISICSMTAYDVGS